MGDLSLSGKFSPLRTVPRKEIKMRIDKFLKMSTVIKRRTIANEAASGGRISINGKAVKPSYDVKVGDIVEIKFGDKISKFEILRIPQRQSEPIETLIKLL